MTYSQMKTAFLEGYDFISNHMNAGLTDDEIGALLTDAYKFLIDKFVSESKIAAVAELLQKLTTSLAICTLENYGTHAYQAAIGDQSVPDGMPPPGGSTPTNVRWITNARVKLTRSEPFTVTSEWVDVEIIPKSLADRYVQTSFNKPIIVFPKMIEHNDYCVIFVDTLTSVITTNGFQLIYIDEPDDIDVTDTTTSPAIHYKYHQEIVDIAVKMAWEKIEPKMAMEQIQVDKAL